MPEGLERIELAVSLIIFIAFVFFWLLPVKLLPFLSEMSGSEIISPIFLYMMGVCVLLIIVAFIIVAIVKK